MITPNEENQAPCISFRFFVFVLLSKLLLSAKPSDDAGGSRIVFSPPNQSIQCKPFLSLPLSLYSNFSLFKIYSKTQCNPKAKTPCRSLSLLTIFFCSFFLSIGSGGVLNPCGTQLLIFWMMPSEALLFNLFKVLIFFWMGW